MNHLKTIAGLFLILGNSSVFALPPGFNIQGRLTDSNGINRNGNSAITFRVCSSPAAACSGDTLLWSKTYSSVDVRNGNFQVLLQDPKDSGSLSGIKELSNLDSAWLEIQVENEAPMAPRQPLSASPLASSSPNLLISTGNVVINSDVNITGSGGIFLRTGNSDKLTILNNGNIGIGTTNPQSKMEVSGNTSNTTWGRFGKTSGASSFSDWAGIDLLMTNEVNGFTGNPAARIAGYLESDSNNYGMSFWTGQSVYGKFNEKMRITSGGSVGIGTTNPGTRLEVATPGGGTTSTDVVTMWNKDDGNNYTGLKFIQGSDIGVSAIRAYRTHTAEDYSTNLTFWTNPAGATHTPTEKMRITREGNVGIGTTVPGYKLDVHGGDIAVSDSSNDPTINFLNNANGSTHAQVLVDEINANTANMHIKTSHSGTLATRLFVKSDGNIGIGTTNPATRLHILGSTGPTETLRIESDWAPTLELKGIGSGGRTWYVQTGNTTSSVGGKLRFYDVTADASRMVIDASGNVGIGIANPNEKLMVAGNVVLTGAMRSLVLGNGQGMKDQGGGDLTLITNFSASPIIFSPNNTEAMRILTNGNVGIGTTNPVHRLEVYGSAGNSTGEWAVLSDKRLKKDISPLKSALETVSKLQGVTFRWADSKKDAESGTVRGLIAQEVEKVIPEWVKTGSDGYKAIEPVGVNALFIEAIKELKSENEALKKRITVLESKKFSNVQ